MVVVPEKPKLGGNGDKTRTQRNHKRAAVVEFWCRFGRVRSKLPKKRSLDLTDPNASETSKNTRGERFSIRAKFTSARQTTRKRHGNCTETTRNTRVECFVHGDVKNTLFLKKSKILLKGKNLLPSIFFPFRSRLDRVCRGKTIFRIFGVFETTSKRLSARSCGRVLGKIEI